MAYDNKGSEGLSAPFNMAISTLMRIDEILKSITKVSSDPFMPTNVKQSMKVNLVKQLFNQSSPLLKEEVVKVYEKQIQDLKPYEADLVIGRSGIVKKKEKRLLFSPELERELDKLCLEIQRELQKEKYFMPPKSDPRFGWKID